jgi:hypothetical protein
MRRTRHREREDEVFGHPDRFEAEPLGFQGHRKMVRGIERTETHTELQHASLRRGPGEWGVEEIASLGLRDASLPGVKGSRGATGATSRRRPSDLRATLISRDKDLSRASNGTPHERDRGAVGYENLLHHLKAVALIEGNVPFVRRLKIRGDSLHIALCKHRSEKSSANSTALVNRIRTESEQVVVWFLRMVPLYCVEQSEPA